METTLGFSCSNLKTCAIQRFFLTPGSLSWVKSKKEESIESYFKCQSSAGSMDPFVLGSLGVSNTALAFEKLKTEKFSELAEPVLFDGSRVLSQ